jgi:hypothetical protein
MLLAKALLGLNARRGMVFSLLDRNDVHLMG